MNKTQKKHTIYNCEKCTFNCIRNTEWVRHLSTAKHSKLILVNQSLIEKPPKHICSICYKEYKSNVGLWKHKKNCKINADFPIESHPLLESKDKIIELLIKENAEFKIIMLDIVKNNGELQKQMFEMCKQNNTTNINTTTNSHNKTFNLQFFLNEECKDAMNLNDFVESVQLQMTDLEKIGELGYVDGVSNFILGKLNETDVNKRPVHCSDAKRETLYIKDDNVWTKEGEENSKIRGAVKKIEKKNIRLLNAWKETHTGCMDSESPYNDQYTHMIIGSLGGCEPDNVNKVIKKIAKATIIDK